VNRLDPNRTDPRSHGDRSGFDPVLIPILLVGAILLLANLGDRSLWTDEAETAGLAKNILRFGVPRAFDGVNYISQWIVAGREDFNQDLIWVLSPWLQLYVTAGSFAALGASPFSARLPFALLGVANLWMIHALGRALFADRRVARLAALLLLFCVPFLLHMRQARYYALIVFFTMAAVLGYQRLLDRRRGSALLLVASIVLLFHSNYGVCVPLVAALAIHAAIFARSRIPLRAALGIGAGVFALTAPWALYAGIHRTSSLIDPSHFAFNLLNYLLTINHAILPLAIPALALGLRLALRRPAAAPPALPLSQPGVALLAGISVAGLLFASINANYFFRYAINLAPLLVLLNAASLLQITDLLGERFGARAGRVALTALVPILLLTTVPSQVFFPLLRALEARAPREPWADDPLLRRPRAELGALRSELFDFAHEITHPYRGPDAAIATFLRDHADPGDVVFLHYGDLPLIVATGLAVRGGSQGVPYAGEPDWIVLRAFEEQDALRRFAREHGYREHTLDVADTRWENQPDPYAHRFREVAATPGGHRPIVIYEHPRKQRASAASPEQLQVPAPHGPLPATRRGDPPNVLLISLDSLRADRVLDWASHYTEPTRLARFAANSTLFTLCRTVSPGTASAAASLLTGRDPRDLGNPGPTRAIPAGVPTLATLLRQSGYQTAAALPNVTLPAELGLAAGFDAWLAPPAGIARREDFAVTREARHWLLSQDGAKPWLLWVHLNAAHGPYRAALEPFGSLAPFAARVRARGPADRSALRVLTDNSGRGGIPAYQAVAGFRSAAQYQRLYDAQTLVGDFYAGEVLDTLKVLAAEPNTIVAIVGTHGESIGEQDIHFNHGENLDESALWVPLIVHVPGQAPAVIGDPVSILDVTPTLLTLAGAPAAADVDGVDLAPIWLGDGVPDGRAGVPSMLDAPQGPATVAAISGRHHRVERDAAGAIRTVEVSQPASPGGDAGAEIAALTAALARSEARAPATPGASIPLSAARRAALVSLGYVDERLPAATE
jgi:arylsulfatase A-like enzyme/4-amino-4-deoxy-L-arabinose transferase-like glycosyltransferase